MHSPTGTFNGEKRLFVAPTRAKFTLTTLKSDTAAVDSL
jgi:hypothetical protein